MLFRILQGYSLHWVAIRGGLERQIRGKGPAVMLGGEPEEAAGAIPGDEELLLIAENGHSWVLMTNFC